MKDKILQIGLVVMLSLAAGCGKGREKSPSETPSADRGRVAIVDLDSVALAIGEQSKVKEAIERDQKELTADMDSLVQAARSDLEKTRKDLGESPSPAQQKQLHARQAELEQALEMRRTQAENLLRARQNARIEAFRGQAKPLVAKLARSRGFSVVLTPTPVGGLLWSDGVVDLTDALIEEINKLRQSGQFNMNPTTAPAPAIPAGLTGGRGG